MAVYKEEKTGTWRVIYRYTDWTGEKKQTQKRGFQTKREAQAWEREQLNKARADLDMTFKSFVEQYMADMQTRIKENTWATKEHIIRSKLLPYFGKLKMSNITAQQIITWQNELMNYKDENGKALSPVYLKTINNQLSAIFNHAVKFYNLKENPCRKAGSMGKKKNREMLFWTKEEYLKFAEVMMDKPQFYSALEKKVEKIQKQNVAIEAVEKIEAKPMVLSSKVTLERSEYESLSTAAKKYVAQEKKEHKLQKALDAAHKMIAELKNTVADLTRKLAAATKELSEYKSVRNKLNAANVEQENERLRNRLRTYEDVISRNNLWSYFSRHRGKTPTKDEAR